jgi:hypothetical protein
MDQVAHHAVCVCDTALKLHIPVSVGYGVRPSHAIVALVGKVFSKPAVRFEFQVQAIQVQSPRLVTETHLVWTRTFRASWENDFPINHNICVNTLVRGRQHIWRVCNGDRFTTSAVAATARHSQRDIEEAIVLTPIIALAETFAFKVALVSHRFKLSVFGAVTVFATSATLAALSLALKWWCGGPCRKQVCRPSCWLSQFSVPVLAW